MNSLSWILPARRAAADGWAGCAVQMHAISAGPKGGSMNDQSLKPALGSMVLVRAAALLLWQGGPCNARACVLVASLCVCEADAVVGRQTHARARSGNHQRHTHKQEASAYHRSPITPHKLQTAQHAYTSYERQPLLFCYAGLCGGMFPALVLVFCAPPFRIPLQLRHQGVSFSSTVDMR